MQRWTTTLLWSWRLLDGCWPAKRLPQRNLPIPHLPHQEGVEEAHVYFQFIRLRWKRAGWPISQDWEELQNRPQCHDRTKCCHWWWRADPTQRSTGRLQSQRSCLGKVDYCGVEQLNRQMGQTRKCISPWRRCHDWRWNLRERRLDFAS